MKTDEVEIGDQVICVRDPSDSLLGYGYKEKVGEVFTVLDKCSSNLYLEGLNACNGDGVGRDPARFKLYKKKGTNMRYEDEWHLNTGQDIPYDADKAWNSDKTSVVAFRYVKKPKVEHRTLYGRPTVGAFGGNITCLDTHLLTLTIVDGDIANVTWEKI